MVFSIWYMVDSTWYIHLRILHSMIAGIPLLIGLRTRAQDPCASVVAWAPLSCVLCASFMRAACECEVSALSLGGA